MKKHSFRGSGSLAVCLLLLTGTIVTSASAQTVTDPRTLEFAPSADHGVVLADGRTAVDRYEVSVFQQGALCAVHTQSIGKPAVGTTGLIRLELSALSWTAAAGVSYDARVTAVGPGGSGESNGSNAFTFTGGCSYSLSHSSASLPAAASTGSIGITTVDDCKWTTASSADWLTVTAGRSGTGSVTFTAAANPSTSPRSAQLTIAGQAVTIVQDGLACTFTLSSARGDFPSDGGVGDVTVTASAPSCTWSAASQAGWLAVTSGGIGSGSGLVTYEVQPNSTTTARSTSLSIAGLDHLVTVAAAAPTTTTIAVRNESQLQSAVARLQSHTTIVLASGTYTLTRPLRIPSGLSDVTLRGASANASSVVLVGRGMNNATHGDVAVGLVAEDAQSLAIEHLTMRDFYAHAIWLGGGARAPRLTNVRLLDIGQTSVLAAWDATRGGVDDGIVEGSHFERTVPGRDANTSAIEVHGGARWRIRASVFRNLAAPAGSMGRPAVLMTGGSRETISERNLFVGCQRGVAYGWKNRSPYDHAGGIIRNNMFYRSASQPGEASILLHASPGTHVLHNTIFTSGTHATPIEYVAPSTVDVVIANNLLDGSIWARDGALGLDTVNDGSATRAFFANPDAGDLHLAAGAPAIDRAAPIVLAGPDWDGDRRPLGGAADFGADEATPPNVAPIVALTSPTQSAVYRARSSVTLTATAADQDGTVVRVDFYVGSTLAGSTSSAPYSVTWRAKQTGTFRLTAVATDNAGASTVSAPVTITITTK